MSYSGNMKKEIVEPSNTKERFIELRAQGYSFDRIAKELGKAKPTLIDWSKDLQEEIANRKALELEVIYEKFFLLKEARLQTLGEMIAKIKKEVESRSLSEVPTDKLLELLLKYNNQVKEEVVEPVFKSSGEIAEEAEERRLLDELTNITPSPEVRKLKTA